MNEPTIDEILEEIYQKQRAKDEKRRKIRELRNKIVGWVILAVIISIPFYSFIYPIVQGLICYWNKEFPLICPIALSIYLNQEKVDDLSMKALKEAMKMWENSSEGMLKFSITNNNWFHDISVNFVHQVSRFKYAAGVSEKHETTGIIYLIPFKFKSRHVTIEQTHNYCELVVTIAHELGHSLGLEHSNDFKSIMSPSAYCGAIITESDRKNLIENLKWGKY